MSTKERKKEEPEEKERIDHPDFSRMDYPFGIPQHIFNASWQLTGHVFTVYAFYGNFTHQTPLSTILFEFAYAIFSGMGITVGCHRYWTHKTFKAKLSLQILLMIMQTMANQYPIRKWSLDHRIHHKYTDTNTDPHNSKRGFWFSHMGWLFLPKHPDLEKKLKTFYIDDLDNDPLVRFQSRWYWTLVSIFQFALPIYIIHCFWGLTFWQCVAVNYRRYVMSLHFTYCVNSFAHMWGDKPYDKNITSTENAFVSFFAAGEGWHNYHHTFPWDYKASEFGWKINMSTMFIDFFAWVGWAYDLKTVSQKLLKNRLNRTGDGSHVQFHKEEDDFAYSTSADVTDLMSRSVDKPIWGWDDDKLPEDFRLITKILRPGGIK